MPDERSGRRRSLSGRASTAAGRARRRRAAAARGPAVAALLARREGQCRAPRPLRPQPSAEPVCVTRRFLAGAAPRVVRAAGAAGGAAATAPPAAARPVLPPRVRHAAGETQPQAQVGTAPGRAWRPRRGDERALPQVARRSGQRVPQAVDQAAVGGAGRARQVALVPAIPRGRAPAAPAAAA